MLDKTNFFIILIIKKEMEEKKICSSVNLNCDDMKLKIGTTDRKIANTIYFEGGLYIKPIIEKERYTNDFVHIKKDITKKIKNTLEYDDVFDKNFMFLIDVADEWISINKKSYFSFQLYLKPKQKYNFLNFAKEQERNNIVCNLEIEKIFNDYGYECYKTRK